MADVAHIKVVGSGPFPLPGEKKHWRRAEESARELLRLAEEIDRRAREGDRG